MLTTVFFFFQAEDGIRDLIVTGVQTCALPISDRDVRRLLAEYLPSVEFALFKKLRDAIESGRWGVGRFRLGRALASRLRPYRRVARPRATPARGPPPGREAWGAPPGGGRAAAGLPPGAGRRGGG